MKALLNIRMFLEGLTPNRVDSDGRLDFTDHWILSAFVSKLAPPKKVVSLVRGEKPSEILSGIIARLHAMESAGEFEECSSETRFKLHEVVLEACEQIDRVADAEDIARPRDLRDYPRFDAIRPVLQVVPVHAVGDRL